MKVLLAVPAAAACWSAARGDVAPQRSDALEEALVSGDECRDEGCSLNALQLRASSAHQQDADTQCSPKGQWCGSSSATKPCCGSGDQCLPVGGVFKCQPAPAAAPNATQGHCRPLNQRCGEDFPEHECCGDENECAPGDGFQGFRCQPAALVGDQDDHPVHGMCAKVGAKCGEKVPERPCCDTDASCLPVGDVFMCNVAQLSPKSLAGDTCMADGQWCGNSYPERACCGEDKYCRHDGNVFRCLAPSKTTYPPDFTCTPNGQVCGGPAGTPLPCCGTAKCKEAGRGLKVCSDPDFSCAAQDATCGGLDRDPKSCCDSKLTCQLQPGDSGLFKCEEPCVVGWGQICGGRGHRQCACSRGKCKLVWWNVFSQKERCL